MASSAAPTFPLMAPADDSAGVSARSRVVGGAAVVAVVLYMALTTASRSFCPGGVTGDGGFTDADGMPTDVAPTCLSVVVRPHVLVVLLVIAAYIGGRVLAWRAADRPERARTILGTTLAVVILLPLVAFVASYAWLALYPFDTWRAGDKVLAPFPVYIEVTTSLMNTG